MSEDAVKWENKIFAHKHLDPECVEHGCKSLFLDRAKERIAALEVDRDHALAAHKLAKTRAERTEKERDEERHDRQDADMRANETIIQLAEERAHLDELVNKALAVLEEYKGLDSLPVCVMDANALIQKLRGRR